MLPLSKTTTLDVGKATLNVLKTSSVPYNASISLQNVRMVTVGLSMSLNFKTSGAPHSTPFSRVGSLRLQHGQQGPVAGLQGELAAPGKVTAFCQPLGRIQGQQVTIGDHNSPWFYTSRSICEVLTIFPSPSRLMTVSVSLPGIESTSTGTFSGVGMETTSTGITFCFSVSATG